MRPAIPGANPTEPLAAVKRWWPPCGKRCSGGCADQCKQRSRTRPRKRSKDPAKKESSQHGMAASTVLRSLGALPRRCPSDARLWVADTQRPAPRGIAPGLTNLRHWQYPRCLPRRARWRGAHLRSTRRWPQQPLLYPPFDARARHQTPPGSQSRPARVQQQRRRRGAATSKPATAAAKRACRCCPHRRKRFHSPAPPPACLDHEPQPAHQLQRHPLGRHRPLPACLPPPCLKRSEAEPLRPQR